MEKMLDAMMMNLATDDNLMVEMVNKSVIINLQRAGLNALQKKQLEILIKIIGDASDEFYVDFWGNEYCHCDITTFVIDGYKVSIKEWRLG